MPMEELDTRYEQESKFVPITSSDIAVFKAAFDHSVDGLVVLNAVRRVLYINQAAERMIGSKNLVGAHCGTLLHCHDEDHRTLRFDSCYGLGVLETHKSLTHVEMNIISASGKTIPVEVTYSYVPGQNETEYLLMSLRNVSIRKEMEREKRQKEALRYTLQERERLARDLHDGVVQDIAYANMQIKLLVQDILNSHDINIDNIKKISSILEESFVELRGAIHDLTFNVEADLSTFLKQYLLDFQTRTGIQTSLEQDENLHRIEPYMTSQIAKVVQEALTNIRKHANASHVQVLIHITDDDSLTITVEDNGRGFAVKENHTDHYGMKTMQERCELIGGTLSIHSSIGFGTKVQIHVSLN